ncbi:MAG: hypothetical protein A3C43_01970 [Candidatus Schekmanbacteria bacterium RIFCSPHIGHO2_02_FULL_38_11]|uniref:histidine kinase n=1 Tax=Candidatus Schekmanbacteria bacterium RIFCSPLOWO2_12_FULL_38_15 TaxID=1817883 RepID=A0A1F7SFN6_9BACT|nr:MAG: hypothetical protein A2043_06900 [Candidatus Schekmanbacteria bacterium GWA2_38_9]OGL48571.1 MAG: hypothetical protein A3H37_05715 [Candidatus Schekmanbacteria bacterium RIFCSPLOWO2_02_FULL_38_14]OGL52551.1 MAG: hypothetical protein A3G31_11275 [Candidatus Schekmanbacteria bacterium RIFCSPLOWO2_12_FULL_38_15]OGL53260.1 MAG: hypothetical protein A3C43_01970 [Candidatus Schekmanbacteria bacterium RIFCSPHIGHO2_02_FULL_38_11]
MKNNTGLAVIIALVIGIILVVAFNVQKSSEKEIASQFNSQQLIVAHEVAILIESFFKKTLDELNLAAFFLGRNISELEETTPLLNKLFSNLQFDSIIISTAFINAKGEMLSQYPTPESLKNKDINSFDNKDFFVFSKQTLKPFISKATMNKGRREIIISFPIHKQTKTEIGEGKEFLGILVCYIDVKELAQTFSKPIKRGVIGYAWILNEDGTLLYHPSHPEMIWRNIFKNDGTCFQCHESFENEKRMVRGEIGTKEYFVKTGGKKIIAYYPIKIFDKRYIPRLSEKGMRIANWSIAVSSPYSNVISLIKQSNRNILFMTGLVVLVLFCGSIYLITINIKRVKAEEKMTWGEKVLEAKNRLQALFDGITDGISIMDKDYRVVAVNKGQVRMSGKSEDELIGQLCYEKFTDKDGVCEGCPVEVTMTTGKSSTGERIVKKESEGKRYWSMLTFPLKDSEGRTTQVIKYVRDITEQKEMNEEIEQSRRLSAMGEMIAGVAHEIKNPLQNISMGISLVKYETEGNKECRETIENIMEGVKSLNTIVEDLLDFSKPMKLDIFKCDIDEILDEVLTSMDEIFEKNHTKIKRDFCGDKKYIRIDGMKIKQVFINLIQNSIEAMPEGGEIMISTKNLSGKGMDYSEVRIRDIGHGIAEGNLGRIFDPFFTTKTKGVGLGMAIIQRIVKLHKGEIKVNSEVGKGTEFILTLYPNSLEY